MSKGFNCVQHGQTRLGRCTPSLSTITNIKRMMELKNKWVRIIASPSQPQFIGREGICIQWFSTGLVQIEFPELVTDGDGDTVHERATFHLSQVEEI